MNPQDNDADLDQLAHRLDDYCRHRSAGSSSSARIRPLDAAHEDLTPNSRKRLNRAQSIADQLARLSAAESGRAGGETSTEPSLIGRAFGRFEIREVLGIGGFGVVYRAFDPNVDREVALKVPRVETLLCAETRQRFLQEARAAARLDHPNIAAVMESGEIGGIPIIVSHYCPGTNLSTWIKSHPQGVPSRTAIAIVLPLAEAIAHAHAQGVLHRDVKPGNVLLGAGDSPDSWRAKLTDFGLAKVVEGSTDHTRTGNVLGTLAYMAPEQAAGRVREITTASDIYGLGMILYELLTGRTAFQADTQVATLSRILFEDAAPPGRWQASIPQDLEAICLKCLEKAPAARYRSAAVLAEDLRRAQRGDPTMARPLTWKENGWRWARRRPALAGLLLVSFLSVVTTCLGATWYSYRLASSVAATESALARAIVSEERAEDLLYAAEMKLAGESLARGDTRQVAQLLDRHAPQAGRADRRTFIWHFLARSVHHAPQTSIDGLGALYCQAASSDGQWLVAGGKHGTLHTIDAGTFAVSSSFDTGQGEINAVAISADDRLIATAGKDGTARLWRPGEARPLLTVPACRDGEAYAVCFAPDSSTLLTAGEDAAIRFWSTENGALIDEIADRSTRRIESLNVSPDGQRTLGIDAEGGIFLIDVRHAEILFEQQVAKLGRATAAEFSPDGSRIAVASAGPGILILDADGRHILSLEAPGHFKHALAWSADGSLLYVGDRIGSIHVIATRPSGDAPDQPSDDAGAAGWSAKVIHSWQAHDGRVWSLGFSPNSGTLVSTGDDGQIKLWDTRQLTPWREMPVAGSARYLRQICFTEDGTALGSTSHELVRLDSRSLESQQVEHVRDSSFSSVVVARDGSTVALLTGALRFRSDSDLTVHDAKDLQLLGRGTIESFDRQANMAFSRDGRHLAIALGLVHNQVRLFEVPSCRQAASAQLENVWMHIPHSVTVGGVECYLVSDNNDLVALRHPDLVEIRRTRAHVSGIHGMAVTPDGARLYSIGGDGLIKAWEVDSLTCSQVFAGEHAQARILALSPDGLTLASASAAAHTFRLWDIRTAQLVTAFTPAGEGPCSTMAFAPDGKRLIITHHNDHHPLVFDAR